jgi:drug/metabolite transporter (DMT)-like permease
MSKGVWYMLIATFFFSAMNVAVKMVPHIPAVEIVFFRSLISLVISFSILRMTGVDLWGQNRKLLILRGVAGALALVLYFRLIQDIPFASAVTILFLAPIFTTIFGIFTVKEKVHPVQWLFFVVSFVGIVVIKGFDTRIGLIYLVIGVTASIFSGIAHNVIRKINTREHPLVIIFYFPLITAPVTGLFSSFIWVAPRGWDWLLLLLIGVLTQVAQYFMTKSYQAEEISKVASIRYISILYALGFGYFIFGEKYTPMVYFGMGLTILGVVLNIWYKHNRLRADWSIFTGKWQN